jgi:hypothetical protein
MSDHVIDGKYFLLEGMPNGIIDGEYMRRSGGMAWTTARLTFL